MSREFTDLLSVDPRSIPGLAALIPSFSYVLDDLSGLSDEDLVRRTLAAFPRVALWALRTARTSEDLAGAFLRFATAFEELLAADSGLEALGAIFHYIARVSEDLQAATFHGTLVERLPPAREVAVTLIDKWTEIGRKKGRDEGLKQGLKQGLDMGRAEGLRAVLRVQIAQRFGSLSPAEEARLAAAGACALEQAAARILTADSFDAVLPA